MRNSLLAFDLDGTTIDNNYMMSENFVHLINEVKNKIIVCIATGRSVSDAIRYYRQLALNTPMICYNGGFIWNPQNRKTIYTEPLLYANEIVSSVINEFPKEAIENIILSCGEKTFYLNEKNQYMYNMLVDNGLPHGYATANILENSDIHRIVISTNNKYKKILLSQISAIGQNQVKIFGWREHQEIIDISIRTVNKWQAIEMVCRNFQISDQSVISIGDGSNDLEMIMKSQVGICMSNANESMKSSCSIISDSDCNKDGAYITLKKYLQV